MLMILIYFLIFALFNIVNLRTYKDRNIPQVEKKMKYQLSESNHIYEQIKDFINSIKNNPEDILKVKSLNDTIKKLTRENNLTLINPMIDDLLFNKSILFINDTYDVIKKNSSVLDYIIDLVNYIEENNNSSINMSIVFYKIHDFLIYPGIDIVVNYFKNYPDIIFDIFEVCINKTKVYAFYNTIREVIYIYKDILGPFAYDLLIAYNDSQRMAEVYNIFLNSSDSSVLFMADLQTYLEPLGYYELSKLIHFDEKIFESVKNVIFENRRGRGALFVLLQINEASIIPINLIKNWGNKKYYLNYIPKILDTILSLDDFDFVFKSIGSEIKETIKNNVKKEDYLNLLTNNLMVKVEKIFTDEGFAKGYFSPDCDYLLNKVYFSKLQQLTAFYVKKIAIDTTKNKNDFLTYENCLQNRDFDEIADYNFTISPAFLIGIIDDITTKNKFKKSILNEKYNYINSFCFPYGKYKEETNGKKEICSMNDYKNLMQVVIKLIYNINITNVNTIIISEKRFSSRDYLFCILSLIIIFLPLLIKLILMLYKTIKTREHKRKHKLKPLINSQEKDSNFKNIKLIPKKFDPPNLYKYLHIYFNITKNIKELFNFNRNATNFNNLNGINYIKGILGIAMLLYIFGQIFLVLFNLPSKTISQTSFFDTINSPAYVLIFFSLRYCPRIIFSCSGYILIYKFLCYIETEQRYYFLKFLFLQSYKYILLLFVALYMRYLLYYMDIIITPKRNPIKELYKYNNEHDENFYERFFSFLLYSSGTNEYNKRQNLVQYFYIPLNEMFLFLFGIAFISLGYKCKLRIDYFIIILTLLIYFGKIIFYVIYLHDKDYFSTLYFYLYDYGELMLNPIFNLPYYLIGMYFGLINFSNQKGITLYKADKFDSYRAIELFEQNLDSNSFNEEDENEEEKDEKINNLYDSDDNSVSSDLESRGRKSYVNISQIEPDKINSYKYINSSFSKEIRKYKKKSKKKVEKDLNNMDEDQNLGYDEKIEEMPFLKSPIKFLNFHRKITRQCSIRIVFLFFIAFIIFSTVFQWIILGITVEKKEDPFEKYSMEDFISNYVLNIYYLIDIELVVFMINWIFFVMYSKTEKSADIFDFLNNIYWSFFAKSYFSFTVISTPIILYIFYQSETVVELYLGNIFLYFSIDIIFILLGDILFYSFFEFPFKKIFKTFFIREEIINIEYEGQNEDENDDMDNDEIKALSKNKK
jgi:hypothetical protein